MYKKMIKHTSVNAQNSQKSAPEDVSVLPELNDHKIMSNYNTLALTHDLKATP
jgi:hypothetical protein